jgi:uncharacterized OsmC-like protein
VAAVAAEKKICLESLQTHVQLRSYDGDGGKKGFSIGIDIAGRLTERERRILANTAKRCEISKMLNDTVDIRYQINSHRLTEADYK